jgi:hypothetical protein
MDVMIIHFMYLNFHPLLCQEIRQQESSAPITPQQYELLI